MMLAANSLLKDMRGRNAQKISKLCCGVDMCVDAIVSLLRPRFHEKATGKTTCNTSTWMSDVLVFILSWPQHFADSQHSNCSGMSSHSHGLQTANGARLYNKYAIGAIGK